ncbi:hypothetical protein GIX45_10155 [Erwinia sp. CPCC 100877]|nr:hypothetical protein [Erwinia sp. CPCC 100877]
MKKQVYHWQPELSLTIIYWSCSLGILFLSLILTLEHNQPYTISNIVLGIFFFSVFLGFRRYFIIAEDYLEIHALLPIKRKKITLSSIETVRVGPRCIELTSVEIKETKQLYIMSKKTKAAFIHQLSSNHLVNATIIEDATLKCGKQD